MARILERPTGKPRRWPRRSLAALALAGILAGCDVSTPLASAPPTASRPGPSVAPASSVSRLPVGISWDVHLEWTEEYDGIKDTIVFEGTVGGQPGQRSMTGEGTATGRRAGWKACNPGIEDIPGGSGAATFGAEMQGDRMFVSAFANAENPLAGVLTGVFNLPTGGGSAEIERLPPTGTLCPRSMYGWITVTPVSTP